MKILQLTLLVTILLFQKTHAGATEFEGIITYKLTIIPKYKDVKSGPLYKYIGKEHVLYYKNGAHLWKSSKSDFEYELYNPAADSLHIYTKYLANDTLFASSTYDSTQHVSKIVDLEKEVILGKICRGAAVYMVNEKDKVKYIRTWYTPSKGTEIAPGRYISFPALGTRAIVEYLGGWPYRILMEWPNMGYSLIYEAKTAEMKPLDDSLFELNKTAPVKPDNSSY